MKILKEKSEEEQRSSHPTMTTKVVSFPTEIVEDIVSRLPVRSILRSRSVSGQWLNLLSDPSFNKLQFTRATESHRTALFFSAYDYDTKKRYYLTASKDGGPLTLLMTFDDGVGNIDMTGPSHLNGLMCFTSMTKTSTGIQSLALLVNPATRKVFKLPDMNSPYAEYHLLGYLYGFDESRNDHKILLIKKVFKTNKYEFMVFSMSTLLWRKIDAEPPVGFEWDRLRGGFGSGVCLNSVVNVMFDNLSFDILAFDFIEEKFSFISFPQGFLPEDHGEENEEGLRKFYIPSLCKYVR